MHPKGVAWGPHPGLLEPFVPHSLPAPLELAPFVWPPPVAYASSGSLDLALALADQIQLIVLQLQLEWPLGARTMSLSWIGASRAY